MLASHLHHIRTQDHPVLEVFLILVQRVIIVDILYIRLQSRSRSIILGLRLGVRRVAFRTIEMLIARQNRHLLFVKIRPSIIVEIISRRVIER